MYLRFCVFDVMLCVDVESNPGPTIEQMLELLVGQKVMQQRLGFIYTKLNEIVSYVATVKEFNSRKKTWSK